MTERQVHELTYHTEYARQFGAELLQQPFSYDIVSSPARRWWNAHWEMYSLLLQQSVAHKRVLVIGCGFGQDALYLAKLGATVNACDLSPDMLAVAQRLAKREHLQIGFCQMPAEDLAYQANTFDYVIARDILHHVHIPQAMAEIQRVTKNGALFVASEIYTHSRLDALRHTAVVENVLHPYLKNFVYAGCVYTTQDERKLNERDLQDIRQALDGVVFEKYFDCVVNRVLPKNSAVINKIDRLFLMGLKPLSPMLGGRVILAGHVRKSEPEKMGG